MKLLTDLFLNGCITKVSMERVKDGYEYGIVVFIGSCHLYAKAILSTNYAIYTIISDNNLFVDHYVNCILTADKHGKLSLIGLISDNKGLRPMLAAVFLAKDKSF
jgi:hypothetical protein